MPSLPSREKDEVLFVLNLQPYFRTWCFQQKLETLDTLFSPREYYSFLWRVPWMKMGMSTQMVLLTSVINSTGSIKKEPDLSDSNEKSGFLLSSSRRTGPCCKHHSPSEFCKINKITLKLWKWTPEPRQHSFLFLYTATVLSEEICVWLTALIFFQIKKKFPKSVIAMSMQSNHTTNLWSLKYWVLVSKSFSKYMAANFSRTTVTKIFQEAQGFGG